MVGKIKMSPSVPKAVEGADLVVMAVKPQNVDKVYENMKQANMRDDCTLLSVIAGKPINVSYI
jgi:Pyrroline-5-carboxylate reductase